MSHCSSQLSVPPDKCKEGVRGQKKRRGGFRLRLEAVEHCIGELSFILALSLKFLCVCEILGESLKSDFSQVITNCVCWVCFVLFFVVFFETMDLICNNCSHPLL